MPVTLSGGDEAAAFRSQETGLRLWPAQRSSPAGGMQKPRVKLEFDGGRVAGRIGGRLSPAISQRVTELMATSGQSVTHLVLGWALLARPSHESGLRLPASCETLSVSK